MDENQNLPGRAESLHCPYARPLHPPSVGQHCSTHVCQNNLMICDCCGETVPHNEYDGPHKSCAFCSFTFGNTRLENWPPAIQLKILNRKREMHKPEVIRKSRSGLRTWIMQLVGARP